MAKYLNRATLLGHVGKDPEVKYLPSGMAVAKFSIATNENFKAKNGEWEERVEWHNVVAFDKRAEVLGRYVKKGDRLYVEGKLRTSSWEDKEKSVTKYRTEILVEDFTLLGYEQRTDEDAPF